MNIYIIPFLLFIVGAWFYYDRKMKSRKAHYAKKRLQYIQLHGELTNEQKQNLEQGTPWKGMASSLLVELFGEPHRKRVLNQSVSKFIWTYSDQFVYLEEDVVIEWKEK